MGALGHVHRLHGPGVDLRVPHAGGEGTRGGVEILDLLRLAARLIEEHRQVHRVGEGTPRVAAHQVGHQVLLQAVAAVEALVLLLEPLIDLEVGLAHVVQHPGGAVLRGHLQLAGDVVADQVREELAVVPAEHVVVADAAADEDLLHPGDGPELPQQAQVVPVVRVQVFAGGGGQAGAVLAHAVLCLLLAGGVAEVGGGSPHVMDVALELGVSGEALHLPDHALVAPGGDHPPLVEGQGAEVAPAEAAPVVGHGEADLLDGGHAPQGLVHGVDLPGVGQLRHRVQLLPAQGHGGGIHHQDPVPVGLADGPAPDGVVLLILHLGGQGVVPLAGGHILKGGHVHGGEGDLRVGGGIGGAPHVGEGAHRLPGGQPPGDLPGGPLPHAVDQQVRLGVEEDGAADLVIPVVVVGEAAETGLQAADDDGGAGEGLPGPVGVDDGGPVGPQAHPVPRAVGVGGPALLGGGVVGHHGVDVAPADHHAVPGLAHSPEGVGAVPVRLGQHRHPVALRLQHPGDDGRAEAGVVHIGVGGDHQKVVVPPVPGLHVLPADGEKI